MLWDSEQNTQYKYPSDRPEAARERATRYRAKKKTEKKAEKEAAKEASRVVTSAENTLYEVVTDEATRDCVTSVTSDFEGCNKW